MDLTHLIPSFMRVIRNLDDDTALTTSLPTIEQKALSDPSSLTDTERRQILDFPDVEIQHQNLLAATSSSSSSTHAALLERAATSPALLTQPELDILRHRYWADVSSRESWASVRIYSDLSEADGDELLARLERVRSRVYGVNEEAAIRNADREDFRHQSEAFDEFSRADMEAALARAHPWVRRLWEEEQNGGAGKRFWGYAVYWGVGVKGNDFLDRSDVVLFRARTAIGCGALLSSGWRLEGLGLPDGVDEVVGFEERLGVLRRRFREMRALLPNRKHQFNPYGEETNGLLEGILRNVFLYVDQESMDSVLEGPRWVDDMWVWAVNPDYQEREGGDDTEYRGYLRVRLQQLVHNFYEARRFHDGEGYSMEDLWRAAQRAPRTRAFVSLKDEEAGLWKGGRDVGSAIRPSDVRDRGDT